MGTNREMERVLLNLDDHYYEKGMRKLSLSVKGIRKDRLTRMSRKVAVSMILNSKQSDKFIQQFLENLKDDLEIFGENPYVQQIVENPIADDDLIRKCSMERLYLYLLYLQDEKYQKLMEYLLHKISEEEKIENVDNEWQFIEHFQAVAKEDGLFYAKKDLINFHTAVKSNSLVILSGLSGTGKSRLVQCYAKALGIQKDTFFMIPVRPNWNDDSDLIGFVDSMHMVYRPSDSGFTNILIEAGRKENADKLYMICLDEMNLARVEHYFSQFLSILEMPEASRNLRLYASEYESRLYNSDKYPSVLKIGNNIRFIGTVNIDESTFHFSDKVLDRANVIKLDLIPYTQWQSEKVSTERMSITYTRYKEYTRTPKEDILTEREREFIWNVHELINACDKNLGVGPRILKQIGIYLENLPLMDSEDNISRQEGFDLQFVQRIVTKIRGQKEQLESILDTESAQSLEKLFDTYADVSKFARSRKALETKWQEINNYGYTL